MSDIMRVELISHTMEPELICAIAARACTSETIPEGGAHTMDKDMEASLEKALRAALSSNHESIAEHAIFCFAISGVSRVLETQLVRHRIGVSYSIQSGRYNARDPTNLVIPILSLMTPELDQQIENFMIELTRLDDMMKSMGIEAEDRRYFYPQGLKTNIVCTVNARELRHMAGERMCSRAQQELRELVTEMVRQAREVAPTLFEDAGPKCKKLRYCPETRGSCGRFPSLYVLGEEYRIGETKKRPCKEESE